MKVLIDTSVLVASLVQNHPQHERALPWLKKAKNADFEFFISAHSVAELFATLTALPVSPKISPGLAWRLIHENIESFATLITLSSADYIATIRNASNNGIAGGAVYDALIAAAAKKAGADKLITLNVNDFKRVWPEERSRIIEP